MLYKNLRSYYYTKYIAIQYYYVYKQIYKSEIKFYYINTKNIRVNKLIKLLLKTKFLRFQVIYLNIKHIKSPDNIRSKINI